jgi:drug/metabolite transporter (DMT)-like permease
MSAGQSRSGALAGLGAAALFGLGTPLGKRLVSGQSPLWLAALLYLGAGVGLTAYGALSALAGGRRSEARLARRDLPLLAGVIGFGGALGPVLLLLGLQRLSAVASALLLNLEAVFTIVLAVVLFGEHLGRRGTAAAALIVAGAVALSCWPGATGGPGARAGAWPGALLIAGACLAWAIDNNLTQRLSLRDPIALARTKTLGAGLCNLALALTVGATAPPARVVGAALAVGVVSYGISIVLDVYALRLLGAAREAAYFATAPFLGALLALPIVGERPSAHAALAGAVMALGVALLLGERHEHEHTHQPLEHEHAHVHDDHHRHTHPPGSEPTDPAPHSHPHRHEPLTHAHPHVPDLHHRHRH